MTGDTEVFPTPAAIFRRASRCNTRMSSIAQRATAPCKIATISRGKLKHEASSQAPNLRRCVGHHAVFLKSTEAAQEEHRRQMSPLSFFENDGPNFAPNDRSKADMPVLCTQVTKTVKAIMRRRSTSGPQASDEAEKTAALIRVSAAADNSIQPPALEKRKKFLVKSREYASMLFLSGRRAFTPVLQTNTVY
ncbi:uncharacterized protein ACLA_092410 [Aspergillus clavatus NRRL 1]|uniref:Uncharacterized protein n=1 Tax=Aspergillus clavatus (strain ATCC 1007 / CBS 513.65 / DSM 816 / NCTC 3887 / NRRL 1 / QM 1276 / 107) TaxID=344612 RepID=A1CF94_ASPCL|nr:uncharacterized protein ACLA_092410 [Aspergillus clavatus NRRL 1]EAW11543.1 conserved hypothetical protein [Aspergillus clavatus NRRL 1]